MGEHTWPLCGVKRRYTLVKQAHKRAALAYNGAISSFRSALRMLASNVHSGCAAAHKEYAEMVKSIESNCKSRKEVYIATLCIACWAKHLTNKPKARACWKRERKAPTTKWDIHAGKLDRFLSKATNVNRYGPSNWKPSGKCKAIPVKKPRYTVHRNAACHPGPGAFKTYNQNALWNMRGNRGRNWNRICKGACTKAGSRCKAFSRFMKYGQEFCTLRSRGCRLKKDGTTKGDIYYVKH